MRPIIVVLLALLSPALLAQNAPVPAAIAQRLDTPQVRVYVATLQPHTPSISRNGHATHRVLIYMDDGAMTIKEGAETSTISFKRGDVRWRPASGAYTAENVSDHPIRLLEIDLKGPPAGPAPVSKLDPHEHILNRVVFYVNDQTAAKADEVRISGAATHAEANDSAQPAYRIAVELK